MSYEFNLRNLKNSTIHPTTPACVAWETLQRKIQRFVLLSTVVGKLFAQSTYTITLILV
jgi:hypothetical protein